MKFYAAILTWLFLTFSPVVLAGKADVIDVQVSSSGENRYNFTVTVLHKDTGWQHYANKWEVLDLDGSVLGTRVLHHPHVNEQPFSRRLSGIQIPEHINEVLIRAHDSTHRYGGKTVSVSLPQH